MLTVSVSNGETVKYYIDQWGCQRTSTRQSSGLHSWVSSTKALYVRTFWFDDPRVHEGSGWITFSEIMLCMSDKPITTESNVDWISDKRA
jgi:hypothetical protein